MSIFGNNKNAIVFTNLIVKVRKYENQKPYFSFHDQPAISDETKAKAVVEKLNELAQLDIEDGWMVVKFDKHSLILKIAKDFNLKTRFVTWPVN